MQRLALLLQFFCLVASALCNKLSLLEQAQTAKTQLQTQFENFQSQVDGTTATWGDVTEAFYTQVSQIPPTICYSGKVVLQSDSFLVKELIFLPGCVTPPHTHSATCSLKNTGKSNVLNILFTTEQPQDCKPSVFSEMTTSTTTIRITNIEVLQPSNYSVDSNPGHGGHVVINPDPIATATTRHLYGTGDVNAVNKNVYSMSPDFTNLTSGVLLDYRAWIVTHGTQEVARRLTAKYACPSSGNRNLRV